MGLVKILNTDFQHGDERGMLVQLVHDGFKQVNVITSKAGAIRGGHYHKINEEVFYVISGKLNLKLKKEDQHEECVFEAGDFFMVDKNVMHDFEFVSDTILVSMYSFGVELGDGRMDIYNE